MATCLLLLLPASREFAARCGGGDLGNIAGMCFGLAVQSKVLNLASDATDVAMAMFSGIYNVGIGGGAACSSLVVSHLGLREIGVAAGLLAVAGLLLCGVATYSSLDRQHAGGIAASSGPRCRAVRERNLGCLVTVRRAACCEWS